MALDPETLTEKFNKVIENYDASLALKDSIIKIQELQIGLLQERIVRLELDKAGAKLYTSLTLSR